MSITINGESYTPSTLNPIFHNYTIELKCPHYGFPSTSENWVSLHPSTKHELIAKTDNLISTMTELHRILREFNVFYQSMDYAKCELYVEFVEDDLAKCRTFTRVKLLDEVKGIRKHEDK